MGGAEQEGEGKGGGNKMISFAYGELEWELAGHIHRQEAEANACWTSACSRGLQRQMTSIDE